MENKVAIQALLCEATDVAASTFLSRKEVIQPHLPVRLPCYDFTPIADHTFGAFLPEGLVWQLQVSPTFVV